MSEQPESPRPAWARPVSRRSALFLGGGAIVLGGLAAGSTRRPGTRALVAVTAGAPSASLHMVRPHDMLVLDFDFYNLAPSYATDPPRLTRVDPAGFAYVIVEFEPQHVMEQTVYESDLPHAPAPGSVLSKAVGPSRIAFVVPGTVKSLPYTEEGLLEWWQWVMQVVTGPPAGLPPDALHTDLLLVDWIHLTPDTFSTWSHASAPVTHGDRTELWHTRLAPRGPKGTPQETVGLAHPADGTVPTVRGVYYDSPATPAEHDAFGALFPPNFDDPPRQIVHLSGDPGVDVHRQVRAELLSLSAMGATVDLLGQWEPSADYDILRWEHHAWLGRDNKVVVEEYGFLFPFGHRALFISETKRLVDEATGVAYLEQREFIKITEFVREFPAPFQPSAGRAFPFSRITVNTATLPDLPKAKDPLVPGPPDTTSVAFWIQDINGLRPGGGNNDVVFSLSATDMTGRQVEFTSPLAFVPGANGTDMHDAVFTAVLAAYDTYDDIEDSTSSGFNQRRVIDMRGQDVAYAPPDKPGDTTFPTRTWFWGVEQPESEVAPPLPKGGQPDGKDHASIDSPVFFPKLFAAVAQIPAVDATLGTGDPFYLVHDRTYLKSGFGHIQALVDSGDDPRVFARVQRSVAAIHQAVVNGDTSADLPVTREVSNSQNVGGFSTPNIGVGALSTAMGAVSGSQQAVTDLQNSGKWDPKQYFSNFGDTIQQALLFGQIALSDVFDLVGSSLGPKIVRTTDYPKDKDGKPITTDKPIGQTVTMTLKGPLSKTKTPRPVQVVVDGSGEVLSTVTIQASNQINYVTADQDTVDKAVAKLVATVSTFGLGLGPIDIIWNKLEVTYQLGKGFDFNPDIKTVKFNAPFDFVAALLEAFGDSGGPDSQDRTKAVLPAAAAKKSGLGFKLMGADLTHVGAGVTLDIPDVPMGIFALDGIHFEAGVIVPFVVIPFLNGVSDDRPRARFAFGAPDDKFKISVYGIGGGGHFEIEVSSRRIEKLEASVEIIGNFDLDVLVAAGRVLLEIGVTFKLVLHDNDTDASKSTAETDLGGYVRLTGRLSVLGLICINAELYASITYAIGGALTFHAQASVSIDIGFWHVGVSIEFTKVMAGGSGSSPAAGGAAASARKGRALDPAGRANTFGDLVSSDDWNLYCDAFAGV